MSMVKWRRRQQQNYSRRVHAPISILFYLFNYWLFSFISVFISFLSSAVRICWLCASLLPILSNCCCTKLQHHHHFRNGRNSLSLVLNEMNSAHGLLFTVCDFPAPSEIRVRNCLLVQLENFCYLEFIISVLLIELCHFFSSALLWWFVFLLPWNHLDDFFNSYLAIQVIPMKRE